MKKKSNIPVMYTLIAVYITWSLFNILEDNSITLEHQVSYVLLIVIPLALIIFSVWQYNRRKDVSVFAAGAIYAPMAAASALLGASIHFGPFAVVPAAVIGIAVMLLGFNRIRNLGAARTLISIDLPRDEAMKIEKRLAYERFRKFSLIPEQKLLESISVQPGRGVAHLAISRDPMLVEEMSGKKLLAEQHGESPKELPAHLKDPDRRWCALGVNPVVIAVNQAAWKKRMEKDASPIQMLETLLSPNLIGSFVLPDPEKSDAGFLFLAGLTQHMGETEGMELMTSLKKSAKRMLSDPINVKEIFADQEILAAVGLLDAFLQNYSLRNPPLLGIPEGAAWEMVMTAIPLSSPSEEQSIAFLEFVAGRAGNEVMASKMRLMPAHPRAWGPPGCPPVESAALNKEFDLKKALTERSELLRKWKAFVPPPKEEESAG